jgi:hypothetical protein
MRIYNDLGEKGVRRRLFCCFTARKERRKKMGKLLLSRRYNSLPLLRSHPGGVQEELAVKDLPAANIEKGIGCG